MRELIEKTKLAVDAFVYFANANADKPITLQIDGTLGSDTIAVAGAGVVPTENTALYDDAATPAVLQFVTATPMLVFTAPVRLIITKPTTTNAVGLMELTCAMAGDVIRKLVMLDGLVMHDDLRMV